MSKQSINIVCRCVPRNPFYMRWINSYGGFDYWMFEKRQTYEREVKSLETFKPYIDNFSTAHGTDIVFRKELESKVTVGVEGLAANEWRLLSFIARSPFVQWYDEEKQLWTNVVVEKCKQALQTDNALHGMEYTIQLPTLQLAL